MTSLKYHPSPISNQKSCWTKLLVQDFYTKKCLQTRKKKEINIIVKPIHSSLRSESKITITFQFGIEDRNKRKQNPNTPFNSKHPQGGLIFSVSRLIKWRGTLKSMKKWKRTPSARVPPQFEHWLRILWTSYKTSNITMEHRLNWISILLMIYHCFQV